VISKPSLTPVQLPWSISPSTSFLRLVWEERTAVAEIEFCADFGPAFDRASFSPMTAAGSYLDVLIAEPPPVGLPVEESEGRTRFRWVRTTFRTVHTAVTHVAHDNTEVVDESAYDWSGLGEGRWKQGTEPAAFVEAFKRQWVESGICPDPNFYLVRTPGLDQEIRRYLLLGHDGYITVTAESFDWVTVRDLPEW
jgi:hypothetical protein